MTDGAATQRIQEAVEAQVQAFAAASADGSRRVVVKTLGSPAVYVAHEAQRVTPAASVAKLILAVGLFEAARRGEIDLDQRVRVGDLSRTMYPSVIQALDADTTLSVREICGFAMVSSDNPATEYIRHLLGQERIDAVIKDLKLESTVMPVGFSEAELGPVGRANTTTAEDMLRLVEYIHDSEHLDVLRRFLTNYQRNDRIPARLDDEVPVEHKTGSLRGIVNDAGVVLHPQVPIAMVFLTSQQTDNVRTATEIGEVSERIVRIITEGAAY
ncbi:serine hydrolase [Streptacidiphilus sp. MAP5-3]|uniref:serine hydrolase n=1 Tax=unclassified Streptacidiphilus TaxID=2643834 RepID=UPI0035129027